jgi:DNA-binding NarL/FixJ family response regulator
VARRAAQRLRALGVVVTGRRGRGDAAAAGELTAREAEIAALVAQGRTNKEVGAALFLSDKTVEKHLSRAFAKLGVSSRTELAAVLRDPR